MPTQYRKKIIRLTAQRENLQDSVDSDFGDRERESCEAQKNYVYRLFSWNSFA